MKVHFRQFAAYNRYANARLFEAALMLPADDYQRDVQAFFKSLHGTLNHLLVTDRIWMKRLTGHGGHPDNLSAILYDDCASLALARVEEDERIIGYIEALSGPDYEAFVTYATLSGQSHSQKLREILAHWFNHQTHHRGQAHTILSIITGREPPSLDLLGMQRGNFAPDLRTLAGASIQ